MTDMTEIGSVGKKILEICDLLICEIGMKSFYGVYINQDNDRKSRSKTTKWESIVCVFF